MSVLSIKHDVPGYTFFLLNIFISSHTLVYIYIEDVDDIKYEYKDVDVI